MLKRRAPQPITVPYQGAQVPIGEIQTEELSGVLVLFDVDGTLLTRTAPARLAAWNAAARAVLGVSADPMVLGPDGFGLCMGIRISGMGDLAIAQRLVRQLAGRADDALARELLAVETGEYLARLEAPGAAGAVQAGAQRFLTELGARGARCSVVSGNSRAVAEYKLAVAGVTALFCGHGAFGDEGEERSDMLTVAVARDSRPGDRVCYVADSPRDATAGRQAGVPVVAVTSGGYSAAQLGAAQFVLDGLDDTELALAAVAAAALPVPGMQGGISAIPAGESSRRRRDDK